MSKKIFVSSATGVQGSKIVSKLLENAYAVNTLTRKEQNLDKINTYVGDYSHQEIIRKALMGVEVAVYTFPMIFNKATAIEYTTNFINACKAEGVSLVIFNVASDLPNTETGLLALDIKKVIADLFRASDLNVITLIPDIYIDNLAAPWSIPVILEHGVLPYPIASEQKIPWISHEDLANYVLAAIERPDLAGEELVIGGNLWSGEEIATAIATHLNRAVNFVALSPDEFEAQLVPAFGGLAAQEVSNIYRYLSNNHTTLLNKDFKKAQETLSIAPQKLTEWVTSINWEN